MVRGEITTTQNYYIKINIELIYHSFGHTLRCNLTNRYESVLWSRNCWESIILEGNNAKKPIFHFYFILIR